MKEELKEKEWWRHEKYPGNSYVQETGQAEDLRPTADRSMWSGVLGLVGWLHSIRSFLNTFSLDSRHT